MMMNNDSFTPDELALIERLTNAPQPRLRPAAHDAILQQVLDALDAPPAAPSSPPSTPILPLIVLAVILAIGAAIAFVILQNNQPTVQPPLVETFTPTAAASATASATFTATATHTPTASPSASATLTASPSLTVSDSATPTRISPTATNTVIVEESPLPATPTVLVSPTSAEATPTPTLTPTPQLAEIEGVDLVIEGPIEQINGSVIIIYGIEVTLSEDEPLLSVVQVGDTVRIEGDVSDGQQVIVINITLADEAVSVDAETGAVWRDDGSCANPPPDWAPANGWRRRCESGSSNAGGGANPGNGNPGGGQGMGMGMGMGDDD